MSYTTSLFVKFLVMERHAMIMPARCDLAHGDPWPSTVPVMCTRYLHLSVGRKQWSSLHSNYNKARVFPKRITLEFECMPIEAE